MREYGRALLCAIVAAWSIGAPGWADSPASLNDAGIKAFNAGDLDSAVFYFSEALKVDEESEVIRRNLSNAYEHQAGKEFDAGESDRAVRLLERAIDVDPANVSPLVRLGYVFLQLDENYNAIPRLEEAIEVSPDSPEAHFLLGEAYYRDNDVNSALAQWEWVNEVKPDLTGLKDRLETARRENQVEGEYEWKESKRFNITYNPELRPNEVREIIRILDQAYTDIGRRMSNSYPVGPIQVTLYAAEEFNESTMLGKHIGGVFDGTRIRCPVLLESGELVPEETLRQVLYHEYVHVVVKHIAPRGVPWWINEGLAEALSHDISPIESQILRAARSKGAIYPLAELESHQLDKLAPEELSIAYSQSHAAIDYLIQRQGALNVVAVLKRIESGESAEEALRTVCRLSYETLDMALESLIAEL